MKPIAAAAQQHHGSEEKRDQDGRDVGPNDEGHEVPLSLSPGERDGNGHEEH